MFDKLKSLFIEDDGIEVSKPSEAKKKSSDVTSSSTSDTALDYDYTSPENTKADPKFVNVLLKAIEENNMEGFDYLEFKQALQNLSKMDMDEQTKYQSALAMAKTMSATSSNLISSANGYIKVLKNEEAKFKKASDSRRKNQVTGKQAELKKHQQAIALKTKQIEKLQADIVIHQKRLETNNKEIELAKSKVDSTVKRFMIAYKIVMSQIETDIKNMKSYF